MIEELHLHNFKCFEDMTLRLGGLTLLAGTNASGKSSAIQSLLLLRQSHLRGTLARGELLLNGTLTSLGMARDVRYEQAASDEIVIIIQETGGNRMPFTFLVQPGKSDFYRLRSPNTVFIYEQDGSVFTPAFNYLNAERAGPRPTYPMAELRDESIDLGAQGEYTLDVLSRHRDESVAARLVYHDGEGDKIAGNLEYQVRYWMQTIIPGFDFDLDTITSADLMRVGFRLGSGSFKRPTNIGFGLVYTLPIVVGALVAPIGSLFIVENPEAHLHPAGQSRIGRFLARTAAAGVQVIIETHSDHLLNGIRRAVREKVIPPDQVALAFFTTDEDSPSKVVQPKIYASGGIRPWPKGFFDQFERDLRELL